MDFDIESNLNYIYAVYLGVNRIQDFDIKSSYEYNTLLKRKF